MNPTLQLRLQITDERIIIRAAGPLTAATAHLLIKTVVGTLRRFPALVLEIDLTGITAFDDIGDVALHDCAYETARRGIRFTITTPRLALSPRCTNTPVQTRNGIIQRGRCWAARSRSGTICR